MRRAGLALSQPQQSGELEAAQWAGSVLDDGGAARRPSRATGRLSRPLPAPANAVWGLSGGVALPAAERADFESRFGADFSRVRLHADAPAAEVAAGCGARALTVGSDLVFGAGRLAPSRPQGRALLAHELAHVAQLQRPGATAAERATVWRAPEDEMPADAPADKLGIAVSVTATELSSLWLVLDPAARVADFAGTTLYEGDVFALTAQVANEDVEAIAASLPPELEPVPGLRSKRLQFRVRGAPAAGQPPAEVRFTLKFGPSQQDTSVVLHLSALPAEADVVDPAPAENKAQRAALREERRETRRAHRALPREERRAARGERRDERREQRQRARELRRERRELAKQGTCSPKQQALINAALNRAASVASGALARLASGAEGDAAVRAALGRYMKLGSEQWAGDGPVLLTRVRDTLTVARNSMLAAAPGSFDCSGTACDTTTGAHVGQNARGGGVTVCPLWLGATGTGGERLKFSVTASEEDARAYALLHEFVHLSGPGTPGEKYVGDDDWRLVSAQQAPQMADAYAAIAWTLGGAAPGAEK
jgi:hypothetical protein